VKVVVYKQAIFRTTLPHPLNDYAYATYDVGDGCAMPFLVPGVELLSERSDLTLLMLFFSLKPGLHYPS